MKYYVYLFRGFNNYFNRIIKGYDTIAGYLAEMVAEDCFLYSKEVNYNPADNVSIKLIMNDCPFEPDYLIYVDETNDIVSRWFVMETVKTRQGQYEHTLRRDVIFDYRRELQNSRVFIQKAMLPENDPLILNPEGMSFNEIKTEETLLKDNTEISWIVAYLAKNATPETVSVQVESESIDFITLLEIATAAGMTESQLGNLLNFEGNSYPAFFTNRVEIRYGVQDTSSHHSAISPYKRVRSYFNGAFDYLDTDVNSALSWSHPLFASTTVPSGKVVDAIISNKNLILSSMSEITGREYLTNSQLEILNKYNGQTVLYNGGYYTFSVEQASSQDDPTVGPVAYSSLSGFSTAIGGITNPSPNVDGEISIRTKSVKAFVKMTLISSSATTPQLTLDISSARNTIQDQAFDIIAISNGPVKVDNNILIGNEALKVAMAIAKQLDANVYDIQLLPYCPMGSLLDEEGRIITSKGTEHVDYDYINGAGAFRNQKRIQNNEWTIQSTPPTIIAKYTWVNAYPLLSSGTPDYFVRYKPDTVNIVVAQNGRDIEVSVYADEVSQVYALELTVFVDLTIPGATFPAGVVLYPKKASFSTVLNYELTARDSLKIESQCNKYRIVSPNYQGTFDFNVAKNGGKVPYFIAECTYKPYTPYIKVAPSFSWLYGTNFGDNRGLICGGDFSIPRFTSQWETFQLNNKNYQNIFNREIQSLDLQQSIEMRNQIVGASVGTLSQASSGALAGFAASGSPYGAIAGAAVGAIGGAIGGVIDTETLARMQRDQRSLAIDKYNYQLGNIKALPYTMTKVGAFDINSKIFPFLEFYTCTDEEKEALEEKIAFESMTVMRIGFFGSYYQAFSEPRYFKGELIRNTELAEDNHIFEAIYAELLKGVYI